MKSAKPALKEPPVFVVLVDSRGVIKDVNAKGGANGAESPAISQYAAGDSYLTHCPDEDHRAEVLSLLKGKRSLISFVLPAKSPKSKGWFVVVGVPVGDAIGTGAVLMHIDISEWIPDRADGDDGRPGWPMPALNPEMIQETISKALVKQFGPLPTAEAPRPMRSDPGVDSLSPRQREVLLLVAAGKSNLEIAEELSCSLNTVKRHVTAVLQKLHLPNRTRAAMLANQLNLHRSNN